MPPKSHHTKESCKLSGKRVSHIYVSESQKPNLSGKNMIAATTATKCEMSDLSETHTNLLSPSSSSLLSVLQGTREEDMTPRHHRHDLFQPHQDMDITIYTNVAQGGDPGATSRLKSDINFVSSFLSYSHRCATGLESRTTHLEGGDMM